MDGAAVDARAADAVRRFLLCVAMLALAGCDRAKPADPGALSSPRLSGRLYNCDLTYSAAHGPLTSQSRAQVRMGIDTGPATPGWKVESVTVVEPLPDAAGFDPWLPFLAGPARPFVSQAGADITLSLVDGAPLTFNSLTGDLHWSHEGLLGPTSYVGACY